MDFPLPFSLSSSLLRSKTCWVRCVHAFQFSWKDFEFSSLPTFLVSSIFFSARRTEEPQRKTRTWPENCVVAYFRNRIFPMSILDIIRTGHKWITPYLKLASLFTLYIVVHAQLRRSSRIKPWLKRESRIWNTGFGSWVMGPIASAQNWSCSKNRRSLPVPLDMPTRPPDESPSHYVSHELSTKSVFLGHFVPFVFRVDESIMLRGEGRDWPISP